jgi:hypothetical protein
LFVCPTRRLSYPSRAWSYSLTKSRSEHLARFLENGDLFQLG